MKLGLVIDLDTCVGCHACATACKQWNTSGMTGPLSDDRPYGRDPEGVWFNRIRTFEVEESLETPAVRRCIFRCPCMHCEDGRLALPFVRPVLPINAPKTVLCWLTKRNVWVVICVLGLALMARVNWIRNPARMKKCTLCIDRIYDEELPVASANRLV